MNEVSVLAAAIAGVVSFLSPCVLPLVPGYLSYVSGISYSDRAGSGVAELAIERGVTGAVTTNATAFVLGFTTVFVLLGASATAIGRLLIVQGPLFSKVAGVVIVIFGLHVLGALRIPLLAREKRLEARVAPKTLLGSYTIGMAFAFGWTPCIGPIRSAVPPGEAEVLRLHYDIEAPGEMREDPTQNVLRIARLPGEVARTLGISERAARERIAAGTVRLAQARQSERAPFVEETVFTDRNGMMIAAYLDAYETLGDTVARAFALTTADRLLAQAARPDGTVLHATAGDTSYVDGLMADYAFFADALLDAYQVTGRGPYLAAAKRIMERAVERFWDADGGGFFDRPAEPEAPALLADRAKEFLDTPLPGHNAVAARALEKLYLITTDDRWRELAERTLTAFAAAARDRGSFAATFAMAAEAHLRKPPQTVVIGPAHDARTAALTTAAWRTFPPRAARGDLRSHQRGTGLAARSGRRGRARIPGDPTPRAYVCVGETCAPPTTDDATVRELVRSYGLRGWR